MAVEVRATPLANKIIEELPRRSRRAYDQFEADLAARGCAALAYRLSGDLLDHLCVVHLIGAMRAIVAFESAEVAYVVLVGNHDDSRPPLDVYQQLYVLAGQHITPPARRPPSSSPMHSPPKGTDRSGPSIDLRFDRGLDAPIAAEDFPPPRSPWYSAQPGTYKIEPTVALQRSHRSHILRVLDQHRAQRAASPANLALGPASRNRLPCQHPAVGTRIPADPQML